MRYKKKLLIFNLTNVEIGKQDVISIRYIYSVCTSILLRKRKELLLWKWQQSVVYR